MYVPLLSVPKPTKCIDPTYIGNALSSVNNTAYAIFFPDGEPPVNSLGFWSLTVYDEQGFFVQNSLARYSLGSRDNLQKNDNGSYTILVQSTQPSSGTQNWLPAPMSQGWIPTLRVYGATNEVAQGNWTYPRITRVQ